MAVIYIYNARDRSGKAVNGQLEAENERAAAQRLRDEGLIITSIRQGSQNSNRASGVTADRRSSGVSATMGEIELPWSRVGIGELALLCRQLSVMLKAGLPILRSLAIISEQARNQLLKRALLQVSADVQSGAPIAVAMSRHPKAFPKMMVFMIQAGEVGGAMEAILERLALHYEKERELRGKISNALMYPVSVTIIAIAVIVVLILFVLPSFSTLFVGVDLPPQTRFLLWLPTAFKQYGLYAVISIVGAVVGLKVWSGTNSGALIIDTVALRLPYFGAVTQKVVVSRFCRTFAILTSSGISVLASLELVQNVITNKVITRGLAKARDSIRQGSGIAGPLQMTNVFPSMVIQMIRVGEETGSLEEVLSRVAEFYDMEVEQSLKAMVSLIEPLILVVMAVVAGGIISSIIIPMFDMMGQ